MGECLQTGRLYRCLCQEGHAYLFFTFYRVRTDRTWKHQILLLQRQRKNWLTGVASRWKTRRNHPKKRVGNKWALSILNECFLILVRLRVGLLSMDLAMFNIPNSCVSTFVTTWIQFMYTVPCLASIYILWAMSINYLGLTQYNYTLHMKAQVHSIWVKWITLNSAVSKTVSTSYCI